MDQFDEIYAVSDLHLGGEPGRQIFRGGALLQKLIEYVADRPADRRVAFVINGDFVDFLAEPGARYFDAYGAKDKLLRVSRDPAFSPVWEGLKRLVARPNRRLVVVLGNHDLEMALPRVQEAFVRSIAPSDDAGRGRITFSVLGTGFAALVGNTRVLCLHGNEVDPFNFTDYEKLRCVARDQEFGRNVEDWTPNAGTKLVIDVMNGIKRDRPFIDLLKPETDAVVPVLFAFHEVNVDRVLAAMEIAVKLGRDFIHKTTGLLSLAEAEGNARAAVSPASPGQREDLSEQSQAAAELMNLLGKAFQVPPNTGEDEALRELLDRTEVYFRKQVDPLQLAPTDLEDRLGAWNLTKAAVKAGWSKLIGRSQTETMRAALQHVRQDRSFDPTFQDDDFTRIDKLVPQDVHILVAGHTHLRRSHPRSGGQYINTGTWARLINLSKGILDDAGIFAEFDQKIRAGSMDELDNALIPAKPGQPPSVPVVIHQPSVAVIERQGEGAASALREVNLDQGASGISFREIRDSDDSAIGPSLPGVVDVADTPTAATRSRRRPSGKEVPP